MPKMLKAAIVNCPQCGTRIETATYFPGIVYTDPLTGDHYVCEWGEQPPPNISVRADVSYAKWADHFQVKPCGHDLTAEQAKAVHEERERQLHN